MLEKLNSLIKIYKYKSYRGYHRQGKKDLTYFFMQLILQDKKQRKNFFFKHFGGFFS